MFEESFRRGETSRIIRIRIVSLRGGVTVINVIVRITMVVRMAICYSNQFSNLFKYESRDETANVIQRYTEVFADKFIGKYRAECLS